MMPESQPTLELGAEVPEPTRHAVDDYLSNNPKIAEALHTFQVAQEEYRRSLSALTAVRVITTHSTNLD